MLANVGTLMTHVEGKSVRNPEALMTYEMRICLVFSHSIDPNAGRIPKMMIQPLPFAPFQIYCLLITLEFYVVLYTLLAVLLNLIIRGPMNIIIKNVVKDF